MPAVQNYAGKKGQEWFNNKYQAGLQLEGLRYVFPNKAVLRGIYVPDHHGDTLISAARAEFSFFSFSQGSNHLRAGEIELQNFLLRVRAYRGEEGSSFDKFIDRLKPEVPKSDVPPFKMTTSRIAIDQGTFDYKSYKCDSCTQYLLRNLNMRVGNFRLNGQEASGDVRKLAFKDEYGLHIVNFTARAGYFNNQIVAHNMHLESSRSLIEGDIRLRYDEIGDFSDFVNRVVMFGQIKNASLASADIRYFSNKFPDFKQFTLSGQVQGLVNDMQTQNLEITMGENTYLTGDVALRNVTTPQNMYLKTPNLNLHSVPNDIEYFSALFVEKPLPAVVYRLGEINLSGSYEGFLTSFKADGDIATNLGRIKTEVLLKNLRNPEKISYRGSVQVYNLELGKLLENNSLGPFSASLNLDGKGLDPATMSTKIKGEVRRFEFKDYSYRQMVVDGALAKGTFEGEFFIDDPHIHFDFAGNASFGADTSNYDFVARIDSADLFALNLVQDSVAIFSGTMNIDFKAIDFDRWSGTVQIEDMAYENSLSSHFFKDVFIRSNGFSNPKSLTINSDILEGTLSGNYTFLGLRKVFSNAYKRFGAFMAGDDFETVAENFQYQVRFKNPSILTDIFLPKLHIEPNTRLNGSFSNRDQELKLQLTSDGLRYGATLFRGLDLDLATATANSRLNFMLKNMSFANGYDVDSIQLVNRYATDTLLYNFSWIVRDSIDSYMNLNGFAMQRDTGSFLVSVDESFFNIGRRIFRIVPGARIFKDSSRFFVEDFEIASGPQKIFVNGAISRNSNEILRVNMQDFGLEMLNYFIGTGTTRLDGNLNGNIIVTEILQRPKFLANVQVDSIELNGRSMGNLDLISDYTLKNDTISLDANLQLGNLQTFGAKGFYRADSVGSINLDLNFNRFQLKALNPIVKPVAENLRGMLDGTLSVRGTTKKPDINGRLSLPKVAFTISFLQTDYTLAGNPYINVSNNRIDFPDLKLVDRFFGTGMLSGHISHNNLRDIDLDLSINANEMLVLNTPSNFNDAYYGKAFTTGKILLQGPPEALRVRAVVETEKNTNFNIPIGGATEVQRSGFVTFVSPETEEDTGSEGMQRPIDLDGGLSLNFDIAVDQDAQVSIILNQSTGNKLNATGDGQISMRIPPNSDMELYGTYTVSRGEYRFNLRGMFNKNFVVQPGGTVNWNGDPFAARLDITAVYSTKADPTPFIGELSTGATLTEVYLNIQGPLTDPEITFDIKVPRANPTVQSVLSNRLAESEAINQQVFSLLALNTFTPQSNFLSGTGNGLNQWDIIANQAAAFLNRFTGGYEVSFDYQQANALGNQNNEQAGLNNAELEVGLSKDFFDNRLTISSSLGVPLNNNQSNLAGDFEVIYSLTKDGRLRAKGFNRAIDNQFNLSFGQQQLYQQGVGISYRVDFNSLNALFNSEFKGKAKKEDQPEPVAETD